MLRTKIFEEFCKLTTQDSYSRGLHIAYFQMITKHSGTRIFPKRLVWSEIALFIIQVSEIKFWGNLNSER